jgi:hypothetical protein
MQQGSLGKEANEVIHSSGFLDRSAQVEYKLTNPEFKSMNIELTEEQIQAVASEGEAIVLIDPRTKQSYRLVREEVFQRIQSLLYDDAPWTQQESAILAGLAFNKLDDTDYSEYLRDKP